MYSPFSQKNDLLQIAQKFWSNGLLKHQTKTRAHIHTTNNKKITKIYLVLLLREETFFFRFYFYFFAEMLLKMKFLGEQQKMKKFCEKILLKCCFAYLSSSQKVFLFSQKIISDFGATFRLESYHNFQKYCGFGYTIKWLFEQLDGNNISSGIYN